MSGSYKKQQHNNNVKKKKAIKINTIKFNTLNPACHDAYDVLLYFECI